MSPIYDFVCLSESCKQVFESLVSPSDKELICPNCGGDKSERLPSSIGGYKINWIRGESAVKIGAGSFKKKK